MNSPARIAASSRPGRAGRELMVPERGRLEAVVWI